MAHKNILLSVLFAGVFFIASAMEVEKPDFHELMYRPKCEVNMDAEKIRLDYYGQCDCFKCKLTVIKNLKTGEFKYYKDLFEIVCDEYLDQCYESSDREREFLRQKIEEFEKGEKEKWVNVWRTDKSIQACFSMDCGKYYVAKNLKSGMFSLLRLFTVIPYISMLIGKEEEELEKNILENDSKIKILKQKIEEFEKADVRTKTSEIEDVKMENGD